MKKSKVMLVLVAFLLAAALMIPAMPLGVKTANAAYRLSLGGEIDGIDIGPEGIHNSYAWCTQLFEQNDGDYLWVGTNRDIGAAIMSGSLSALPPETSAIYDFVGIPSPSDDSAGKIYRYRMDTLEPEWEFMWEDGAINGYRKMLMFQGDLYVFAGITTFAAEYSLVYRFGSDFEYGDTPEVVLWSPLPEGSREYFRAAYVYQGKMYVGTFDGKIYVTDGIGLTDLEPNDYGTGDKTTGWDLFVDLVAQGFVEPTAIESLIASGVVDPGSPEAALLTTFGGMPNTTIWDIIGYNNHIYAFMIGDGFRVYKISLDGNAINRIVGQHEGTKYPAGLGVGKVAAAPELGALSPALFHGRHVAASPFISTQDDKEYVYVTTFANGPMFLGGFAKGLTLLGSPATRAQGVTVINAIMDYLHAPAFVYRFDENDNWEVVVGDTSGEFVAERYTGGTTILGNRATQKITKVGNQRAGFFPGAASEANISSNVYAWWMEEHEGKLYVTTWDVGSFRTPFYHLTLGILGYDLNNPATWAPAIAAYQSYFSEKVKNFFTDASSPTGFDLFVSDNGKDFSPMTVTGFAAGSYGGRVLLSTEYGLILCTANPSNGCQVWNVSDPRRGIIDISTLPENIDVKKGELLTFQFDVLMEIADINETDILVGDALTVVNVKRTFVDEDPIISYKAIVERVEVGGKFRWVETDASEFFVVFHYEVTVIANSDYQGEPCVDVFFRNTAIEEEVPDEETPPVHTPNDSPTVPAWVTWTLFGTTVVLAAGVGYLVTMQILLRKKTKVS